ncbi:PDZ and LIM domain protein 3-like isoform X2 [Anneissia japonica]|uniref:PDZ and LIM domain protein 3-like isoform X2 n=1 Tax=Anneissia japonica TaxID=1529436 RepID=UPI0014254FDD|nr:PDZ and LIM domain protein 3-like isoform X2 [Anneissia japonica]
MNTTPGGKANQAKILPGDIVRSINGERTHNMTHLEGQTLIKQAKSLKMIIERGSGFTSSPPPPPIVQLKPLETKEKHKIPMGPREYFPAGTVVYETPGHVYELSPTTSRQKAAMFPTPLKKTPTPRAPPITKVPFRGTAMGGTATVVHNQYNSPMGLYSANNIADTFRGQTEGMITGVLGNDDFIEIDKSACIQLPTAAQIQYTHPYHGGFENSHTNPINQSRSFRILQQLTEDGHQF